MKRFSKHIIVIVFFAVMLYPWLSTLLPSQSMTGVFEESGRPVLSPGRVLDGSYQTDAENFLHEKLPGREYLIKTKNQFVFGLFRKSPVEKVIIGKNHQMFSRSFINLWYELKGPTTDEFITELTGTISRFKALMDEQHIQTVLFVTPSKARFYHDDIPDIYRFAAPEHPEASAYDKLMTSIAPLQIPTFDSIAYLEAHSENSRMDGLPLFNKTGTHWTQSTGAKVAIALGDFLEDATGFNLPEMSADIVPVDTPEYPDADIFGILNMYTKPFDTYTKPVLTITDPAGDAPAILCRGGSFMGQSLAHLIRQGYFSKDVYMENTQFFQNQFVDVTAFNDYGEVDLKEAFQDIDIVILEVNEASVDVMGFGFMEYVYEHRNEIFP